MNAPIGILGASLIAPSEFRWPDGIEAFEGGWLIDARIGQRRHVIRHGPGVRLVYGLDVHHGA